MVFPLFRTLRRPASSARKSWKDHPLWARLDLETLDSRILPSVTAGLNQGILAISAATTNGTAQVEILQSQDQVTVEDTHHLVGSFPVNQIQQIRFEYDRFAVSLPTGQRQITLTGFPVTEADLNLGNQSLTAALAATLPDGKALNLAGAVHTDGTFDLSGAADLQVDGFPLHAAFDLTNQAMKVSAHLVIPHGTDAVDLSGSVDNAGNYDLTGSTQVAVAGFGLHANFTLTNAHLAVAATVGVGGTNLDLSGDVTNQGDYSLTGRAHTTVAGFGLDASFTLTNTSLTAAATLSSGGATVNLSGTVTPQSQYTLTGSSHVTIAGFSLDAGFKLTNSDLTVTGSLSLAGASLNLSGTLNTQGHYTLTDTTHLTIAGFPLDAKFTLTNTSLAADATVNISGTGNLSLSGTVNNQGHFNLTATTHVTVATFPMDAHFALTNTSLAVAATLNLPGVGNLDLSGTVNDKGQYSLTTTAHVTIDGYHLDADFRLTNADLNVTTTLDIPVAGKVNLSGKVNNKGQYSLTASVANFHVLFVTLTSASVDLTNTSLTVKAHAANLPLVGTVDFTGTVKSGDLSFTATVPHVSVLGFTLTNVTVTLDSHNLTATARVANVPIVGNVDFRGQITAGGFTLAVTVPKVSLLGFVNLTNVNLTLTKESLKLDAGADLPVVGVVTFTGDINFNGHFTIAATAKHFTLLGFVGIDNAQVSLSFPNPKLTVAAHVSLLNIGTVDFTGTIGAGGHYSLTGHASLKVAGFSLGSPDLRLGNGPNDPHNAIAIGPFTTPPLPVIGAVTLSGSYAAGGKFSFLATVNPSPPLVIGGVPFNRFTVGLTNDSLTLGAGVGINFSALTIGQAYFQGTIHTNGDFQLLATVDALHVAGFSAAHGRLVLQKAGSQVDLTLDADANFVLVQAHLHGSIHFATGQFTLTGSATVAVAGFTLSNTSLQADNVHGLNIQLHSQTRIANFGEADFAGHLTKTASGYDFAMSATADITVGGFSLAHASLNLDTHQLSVSANFSILGSTADFRGYVRSNGQWSLTADATLHPAGFTLASAHLALGSNQITVSGSLSLAHVGSVVLNGSYQPNGHWSLGFTGNFSMVGFGVNGSLSLGSSGLRVAATMGVSVLGFRMGFSGYVNANGSFRFTVSHSFNFGPAHSTFNLTFSDQGFSAQVHASLDLTAKVGWSIFSITVGVRGSVDFGFSIHTNGTFSANGNVRLTAYAGISATFGIGFTLNNHEFCFDTHNIGFSIWGIGFHPFGDICLRV